MRPLDATHDLIVNTRTEPPDARRMTASFRQLGRLFRHAVWALVALSLVSQPVLAALGELHEAKAHPVTAGLHLEHRAPDSRLASDANSSSEEDGTLHLLLHFAHCCVQTTAMPAIDSLRLAMVPAARLSSAPLDAPQPDARLRQPFRPPIRA